MGPDDLQLLLVQKADDHDEAMDWAKNRVFEINPVTIPAPVGAARSSKPVV